MIEQITPHIIPITINGKETFLKYNTFPVAWYLEHYGVDIENLGNGKDDMQTVIHCLRAGLIEANWNKNKACIDNGKIGEVKPTLSELAEVVTIDTLNDITAQIIDGLLKSLPQGAVGSKPSKKSKKKQIGFNSK